MVYLWIIMAYLLLLLIIINLLWFIFYDIFMSIATSLSLFISSSCSWSCSIALWVRSSRFLRSSSSSSFAFWFLCRRRSRPFMYVRRVSIPLCTERTRIILIFSLLFKPTDHSVITSIVWKYAHKSLQESNLTAWQPCKRLSRPTSNLTNAAASMGPNGISVRVGHVKKLYYSHQAFQWCLRGLEIMTTITIMMEWLSVLMPHSHIYYPICTSSLERTVNFTDYQSTWALVKI